VFSPTLCRATIEPEILPKVKDEILCLDHLAPLNAQHGHAAVQAGSSLPVREFNVPMYGDCICPGQGENILDTDVLDIELNSRELLEEIPEPAFNGALSPERPACVNFTRVNKDAIIPP
jgi:hypothetical protein